MKIVKLTAENFKRLNAVEITPQGNVVMITGQNGAGKSSVLDALMSALCGKKYSPQKPIQIGKDRAEITVITENYIIKQVFTKSGGSLTITNKEGMRATSPQALLDKIVGKIAFDPEDFIKLGETEAGRREQRKILMELAGLDFADIDEKIAELKQQRSNVRATKETYEHEAARIAVPEQTPDEELSLVGLSGKMQEAIQHNAVMDSVLTKIENVKTNIAKLDETLENEESLIANLQKQLDDSKQRHQKNLDLRKGQEENRRALAGNLQPAIDIAPIQKNIFDIEGVNVHVRNKKSKVEWLKKSAGKSAEYAELGKQMTALEDEKAARLSAVKMPIDGISVDEEGVIYDGIPLSQVNDAKQLEIGVAIGMALNPKLKVIRMNGNNLDAKSLEAVAKMVKDKDFQIWIERIENVGQSGVVIEDGNIVEYFAAIPSAE